VLLLTKFGSNLAFLLVIAQRLSDVIKNGQCQQEGAATKHRYLKHAAQNPNHEEIDAHGRGISRKKLDGAALS
jgi:hypothetical protein